MTHTTKRQRWAALCAATFIGIGIPTALHALANRHYTHPPPACADRSSDGDINPRRTCRASYPETDLLAILAARRGAV
jgi:hypothetical protein